MESWYFIIFLFASWILVLCIFIPICKEHKKVTGNVINYDPHMRKFVYKVYMTEEEILRTLMTTGQIDELSCRIDREKS